MWKRGQLNAYQLPTGTVVVKIEDEPTSVDLIACIYARVSSAENKKNLEAQAQRLTNYAIARGYRNGLRRSKRKTEKIIEELTNETS